MIDETKRELMQGGQGRQSCDLGNAAGVICWVVFAGMFWGLVVVAWRLVAWLSTN